MLPQGRAPVWSSAVRLKAELERQNFKKKKIIHPDAWPFSGGPQLLDKSFSQGMFAAVLFALISGSGGVLAQTQSLDELRIAAEAGDSTAQRALAEALVLGIDGATKDIAAGLALLEAAAASGDVEAKANLGKLLLEGYKVPADPDRGAALLTEAIAAGHVGAKTTLGLAYLWGINRPVDPDRARPLLEEAVAGGDLLAVRVLGQYLLGGWVYPQEVDRGIDLLEQAAAAQDSTALVSLGTHYLNRSGARADRDRALEYYEQAAALGNGEGFMTLGSSLMWGKISASEAEAHLRRAGELGVGSAWVTLASGAMYGYLGPRSRAKYDEFAELGRAAGQGRIAVLDAQRQMWGISMRANGPATLAGLRAEAEAGNSEAAQYLIRLVRDGNSLNIRRDRTAAREYLEQFKGLLSADDIARQTFGIEVASTRIVSDFAGLAETYHSRPELKSVEFGEDIYKANANFAFYLLQSAMRENGTYSGALSGMATMRTLRAVYSECQTLFNPERCDDTVMRPDIIGALLAR